MDLVFYIQNYPLGFLQALEHNKQLQHLEPGEMERLNTKCDQRVSGASQLWHYQHPYKYKYSEYFIIVLYHCHHNQLYK